MAAKRDYYDVLGVSRDASVAEVKRSQRTPLASAAPFVTVTSKRYVVMTNAGREFGQAAAKRLESMFQAFAKILGKGLGARNAKNLKVRIFRDDVDFKAYLKKDFSDEAGGQGFYSPGTTTIDLGTGNNPNNDQLDFAAGRVWAMVFTVRMQ